jgi:hypothetical protein
MSRYRAFARLAALVAMLAAAFGVAAFTPLAASAAPSGQYPPPPPNMVVNKGTVKVGVTVHATGRNYAGKEKVYITVTFTPKGSKKSKVVKKATVTADKKGKISFNVKMGGAGTVVITGKGAKSKKSASATVHVINKTKGGWEVKRAAFGTGTTTGSSVVFTSTTESAPSGNAGVAVAALAAMALAGSVLMTRRVVRRRRAGAAA